MEQRGHQPQPQRVTAGCVKSCTVAVMFCMTVSLPNSWAALRDAYRDRRSRFYECWLQSCGGEDRSLLSQAACSIAHQICTARARRSPKVLQQWHVFATLRGPYVEGSFLAQRDTVWHFDGVHSCINCAIGCATAHRVLSKSPIPARIFRRLTLVVECRF